MSSSTANPFTFFPLCRKLPMLSIIINASIVTNLLVITTMLRHSCVASMRMEDSQYHQTTDVPKAWQLHRTFWSLKTRSWLNFSTTIKMRGRRIERMALSFHPSSLKTSWTPKSRVQRLTKNWKRRLKNLRLHMIRHGRNSMMIFSTQLDCKLLR